MNKTSLFSVLVFAIFSQVLAQQAKFEFYAFGSESYLGIQAQEVNKENYVKYGLSSVQGVAVEKVFENSPAAQAGLQSGDVIIRFNDEEVTSIRKLYRLISEVAPDHQVKLRILRGGKEKEVTVTIGRRPKPDFKDVGMITEIPGDLLKLPEEIEKRIPRINDLVWQSGSRRIGIKTMSMTKQLGEYFGVSEGKGVLVTEVLPDSSAAKAGLKAGDVIVEVNGKVVQNVFEFSKMINSQKEGSLTLTIIRDKVKQSLVVTLQTLKSVSNFDLQWDEVSIRPLLMIRLQGNTL